MTGTWTRTAHRDDDGTTYASSYDYDSVTYCNSDCAELEPKGEPEDDKILFLYIFSWDSGIAYAVITRRLIEQRVRSPPNAVLRGAAKEDL